MQSQSLNSITSKDLQALKNTKVFVAGDVILDSYIEGKISRISPEAPAPILLETQKKYVPGGAGNVAANISSIGASVQICSRIGNDPEAKILTETLQKFGVNTQNLLAEDHTPTTTKTRIISYHEFTLNAQQLVRMDRESHEPIQTQSEQKCIKAYQTFIKECKASDCALILSDYGKGFLTQNLISKLIQISVKNNIPVIVDPKSADVSRYAHATVIKPNLAEGRALYKNFDSEKKFDSLLEEAYTIANHYREISQCRNIVMSLSQHGVIGVGIDIATTQNNALPSLHFSTKALQVADVSGAGDTLVAFLAMALAAKLPIHIAINLGNSAAGIVCGKMGTSVVKMDELFEKINAPRQQTSQAKIAMVKDVVPVIRDLQAQKQKIVFTNGCFDILHAGHVQYLQKAKSLGDLLIIGLNSDSSIKRLKGELRPVQTFADRAQILAALACTDFIIEFDEDTPLNLIRAIKPDVLVKGADYTFATTVGAEDVVSWGGRVEHIDLVEGRSTSSILKRI